MMIGLPHHEDNVGGDPYNVNAWTIYLEEIDNLITDILNEKKSATQQLQQQQPNGDASLQELVQLRDLVGRRSVQLLPRSYKLWRLHWEFVKMHLKNLGGSSTMLGCFERAIVTLHKFPRVWIDYLEFAHNQQYHHQQQQSYQHDQENEANDCIVIHPTELRHLVNRSLEALPVTQHDKIWPVLLKYYQSNNVKTAAGYIPKESKLSVLRRYVRYNPGATKKVADFLADDLGQWGEAALMYVDLLNHDDVCEGSRGDGSNTKNTKAPTPTTTAAQRKDLWMSLAKICTRHPVEIEIGLDFEAIVRAILTNSNNKSNNTNRGALRYLPREMEGILWSQLADAWIRRGEFQLARSVYEEAIESVSRVRDFTILMDAYLQFEESLLEATMENQAEIMDVDNEQEEKKDDDIIDDWDILLPQQTDDGTRPNSMSDLELAFARAEDLTARRAVLLNGVLLRQNPDDVGEWLKRAQLYKENDQVQQAAAALEEGLKTVKARRAVGGNSNQMVLDLAKVYEVDCKDVGKARDLFDRICNQWVYEFKNVDDLAECYVAYAELELRQECWDDALDVIRGSVIIPPFAPKWIRGLDRSLRLWDLMLDLEESLGTVQTTKDAYSRAIEQKIATPLYILNFASFLTEQKYFEESFSAYERGIELFQYPGLKLIWKAYLNSFLKRYGGTKLERTRDLFQRCLDSCPPEDCTEFFLSNGNFEEKYGLTKRALGVYRRMSQTVPTQDKYTAYQLLITKTAKYLGQTSTRDIYENAIQALPETAAAKLCLDFANMEISLQEIDRARAVLSYGAQMADPRKNGEYWKAWNEFEISSGNEETFREMLRIKRSVEASFSTVNYNAAEMSGTDSKAEALSNEDAMKMIAQREGVEINPNTSTISGFVPSSSGKRSAQSASLDDVEERVAKLRKATAMTEEIKDDEDEIDIDELVDELDADIDDKESENVLVRSESIDDTTDKI